MSLPDQGIILESQKTPEQIWSEAVYHTVPLEGKMYDVRLYWSNEIPFVIKRMKDDLPEKQSGYGYSGMTLKEIYEQHLDEHKTFVEELGEFVTPTSFSSDVNNHLIIQEFITPGLQYKSAITQNLDPGPSSLPDIQTRKRFYDGIVSLIRRTGKLPDLDFFIVKDPKTQNSRIVVFDTTGFYFDKREGKDEVHLLAKLSKFLKIDETS